MRPTTEHFIGTSVILESLTSRRTEVRRQCERYLVRANRTYIAVLGSPALGEFMDAILKSHDPAELFKFMPTFVEDAEVRVIYPSFRAVKFLKWVRKADDRIDFMDSFHLACARQAHIRVFATIDSKLIHNEVLEKLLDMKICHPKELI